MKREQLAIGDCDLDVMRLGAGAPLVVYHGEYGSMYAQGFLEQLALTHEVIVPHHPGWAGSSRPAHVKTIRDVAFVQQEFLEGLGHPAALVGLSLGGWIAAEVAATWPALIESLVLVSPTGIKAGSREDRDFVDIYVTDPAKRRGLFSSMPDPPASPLLGDQDEYLEIAKAEEAVARYCWGPYMHDPGLRHRLRRVSSPVLVLSGSADRLVLNPAYFQNYAELLGPGAVHRIIDGAGHCIEEEMPGVVVEAIEQFSAAGRPAASHP
jgi:pimeloyl-ACP methyl ester carboxylesterase